MAMKKNNIRSIRFSDEMIDIIDQQVGDNFTQKFERLVYNCYMLAESIIPRWVKSAVRPP